MTATVVADVVPDDDLLQAAADVEAVADRLQAAATGRRTRGHPDPDAGAQHFFPTSPAIGGSNPVAPPVTVWTEDGGIAGEACLGAAYEGPPGCVHGGVLALLFDELLGSACIAAGRAAMTGTLTVRYRRPTPLGQVLTLRARCTGVEGRKVHVRATVSHEEEVTAEARGLFVVVSPERYGAMTATAAARSDRSGAQRPLTGGEAH